MGQCLSLPENPKFVKEKARPKKRQINKALIGKPRDFQHISHGGADGMIMTPGTSRSQLEALKNKMDDFAKILDDMVPDAPVFDDPADAKTSNEPLGESKPAAGEDNFITVLSAHQNSSSGTLDDILKFKDPAGSIFVPKTTSSAGIREPCDETSPLACLESKSSQPRSLVGLFDKSGTSSEVISCQEDSQISKKSLHSLPLPTTGDSHSETNSFIDMPKANALDSSPALLETKNTLNRPSENSIQHISNADPLVDNSSRL
ncbi:hypothetical protein DSO57_1009387 [Entomophthora muscae]|uniref:Uncharacterized protein n=2 Tax=Entomophthora muscae TaxID=34485 RepID=A0ACC2SK99_9FUNG|nr:hypothetical protein DSO57_1009387 [Entomophthora muscae]